MGFSVKVAAPNAAGVGAAQAGTKKPSSKKPGSKKPVSSADAQSDVRCNVIIIASSANILLKD